MLYLVTPLSILRMRSTANPNNWTNCSVRYTIRCTLFFYPMQLLIQGQWWSKARTHFPQSKQCLTLSGWSPSQTLQYLCTAFRASGKGENSEVSTIANPIPISPSKMQGFICDCLSWGIYCVCYLRVPFSLRSVTLMELFMPNSPIYGSFSSWMTDRFLFRGVSFTYLSRTYAGRSFYFVFCLISTLMFLDAV